MCVLLQFIFIDTFLGEKSFSLDGRGTICGNFFDLNLQPKTETFQNKKSQKIK